MAVFFLSVSRFFSPVPCSRVGESRMLRMRFAVLGSPVRMHLYVAAQRVRSASGRPSSPPRRGVWGHPAPPPVAFPARGASGMAIFHFTTKLVSRSKGQSAVAKAAYNARDQLENAQTGEQHDYRRKAGLLFSGLFVAEGGPRLGAGAAGVVVGSRAARAAQRRAACP